jgi:hypothetical protein
MLSSSAGRQSSCDISTCGLHSDICVTPQLCMSCKRWHIKSLRLQRSYGPVATFRTQGGPWRMQPLAIGHTMNKPCHCGVKYFCSYAHHCATECLLAQCGAALCSLAKFYIAASCLCGCLAIMQLLHSAVTYGHLVRLCDST